jgi:hypothetical protein
MWNDERREWPAVGVQVAGVIYRDGGFDELAWWTRTADGWYVSETRGNLGHRDAMTADESKGPDIWCHVPTWKTK